MYFPHAYKKAFFVGPNGLSGTAIALASAATNTGALTAGQMGIVQVSSGQNLVYNNGATINTGTTPYTGSYTGQPFYLAMGSWFKSSGASDKIGVHGGYQESIKSKIINPRYISRVITVKAKTPVNQVVKVNASAHVAVNQTYRLRLDLKGSPALRFLNHQLYRTLDAYTGVVGASGNTWRDPVSVLLGWKEQLNASPLFNQFVQARVYKYAASATATAISVAATTSQVTITVTNTGMAAGQKVVGTGIPANSFITSLVSTTGIVVKYPTQAVAPTISATVALTTFSDLYSANEVAAFVTGSYNSIYIPGTTIATGLAANPTAATLNSDAASQSSTTAGQESHIEFTMAYVDTTFGNATFTPTDKYDLEPLIMYASVQDELSNTNLSTTFPQNPTAVSATNPYLSSHGLEMQAPVQATGYGETVFRDLILEGRYRQEAFPDSSRVESFRMRELEQNPVFTASGGVSRTTYYDQILILHSVPRFNNPSGMFDTDQYLIQIYLPQGSIGQTATTTFLSFITGSANAAQGSNAVTVEAF